MQEKQVLATSRCRARVHLPRTTLSPRYEACSVRSRDAGRVVSATAIGDDDLERLTFSRALKRDGEVRCLIQRGNDHRYSAVRSTRLIPNNQVGRLIDV